MEVPLHFNARPSLSAGGGGGAGQPLILTPAELASYRGAPPTDRPLVIAATEQALADPAQREMIKAQALQFGGQVVVVAKHYGYQGVMAFQDYIQQGPKGVSMLCFMGGTATSVLGFISITNLGGVALDPFHYILSAYMFVFGLVTAIIEADTDRVGTMMTPFDKLAEPITRAQAWLHEEVRILTQLRGRGFFYLYQGTLMVSQCVFCLLFLGGLYNVLIGAVCIMMSFGYQPDIEGMFAMQEVKYSGMPGSGSLEEGSTASVLARHNIVEVQPIEVDFPKAQIAWQSNPDAFPGKTHRELYALHQQAIAGDCNEPKPSGVFNGNDKEQWRLWTHLKGMSMDEAKHEFGKRLRKENVQF